MVYLYIYSISAYLFYGWSWNILGFKKIVRDKEPRINLDDVRLLFAFLKRKG